jgi:hypothetical protein
MSSGAFAVLVLAGLAVAGSIGYLLWLRERKRSEALFAWATANGWRFQVRNDAFAQRWHHHPFGEGDHRRARNICSGTRAGREFHAFDYSFQTHQSNGNGGRTTQTHRFAVCVVTLPTWLPLVQVTPENLLTRLGHAVMPDIELESEEFNRAFRVEAIDAKFASDVLPARTMQLLLGHRGISLRIDGDSLFCWREGETGIATISDQLVAAESLISGIPGFVWRDHGVVQAPVQPAG